MDGNLEAIVDSYTTDGKILPDNTLIMEGHADLKKYWKLPEGVTILHHELNPSEINVLGDYAYDYGYYQGKTKQPGGAIAEWKGKYVVIWKKVGDDWKMYLDIWNRVQQ